MGGKRGEKKSYAKEGLLHLCLLHSQSILSHGSWEQQLAVWYLSCVRRIMVSESAWGMEMFTVYEGRFLGAWRWHRCEAVSYQLILSCRAASSTAYILLVVMLISREHEQWRSAADRQIDEILYPNFWMVDWGMEQLEVLPRPYSEFKREIKPKLR